MKRFLIRFRGQVVDLLRQGITPEKIARAITLGAVLGVLPVLGTTTVLCTIAAAGLGLNLPMMQLAGWIVYPIQLALLVPLMRLGANLFGLIAIPPLADLLEMLSADLWGTIALFWPATLSAVGAWLVLAPPAGALVYVSLLPVLRRLDRQFRREAHL